MSEENGNSNDSGNKLNAMDYVRSVLYESIEAMRDGTEKPGIAAAKTNACGKIINTFRAEMEFAKVSGVKPSSEGSGMFLMEKGTPKQIEETPENVTA